MKKAKASGLQGDFAIKIVTMDVPKLIEQLNKAYSDEWLAFNQYWWCAKMTEGPMRTEIIAELEQHAQEEMAHALLLTNRIIQLGGVPARTPADWYKHAGCRYNGTNFTFVKEVLEENIKGEQCAIEFYNRLLKTIDTKDPVTYDMILRILNDELEHEEDLVKLHNDLMALKKFSGD